MPPPLASEFTFEVTGEYKELKGARKGGTRLLKWAKGSKSEKGAVVAVAGCVGVHGRWKRPLRTEGSEGSKELMPRPDSQSHAAFGA